MREARVWGLSENQVVRDKPRVEFLASRTRSWQTARHHDPVPVLYTVNFTVVLIKTDYFYFCHLILSTHTTAATIRCHLEFIRSQLTSKFGLRQIPAVFGVGPAQLFLYKWGNDDATRT